MVIYIAQIYLASWTQYAYFSHLTHTKKPLLMTICDTTLGIGASFQMDRKGQTDGRTDGQTDA